MCELCAALQVEYAVLKKDEDRGARDEDENRSSGRRAALLCSDLSSDNSFVQFLLLTIILIRGSLLHYANPLTYATTLNSAAIITLPCPFDFLQH